MFESTMKVVLYIFFAYLYISVIVFVYTLIRNMRGNIPYHRNKLNGLPIIFLVGTFIVIGCAFSIGIEKLLVVPAAWGWHDEDGKWVSVNNFLSGILGFVVSGYMFWLIGELQRKEEVIKELQFRYQKLKQMHEIKSALNKPIKVDKITGVQE